MNPSVDCVIFLDIDGVLNRLHIPEADLMLDDDTVIDTSHTAHPSLYLPCLRQFKAMLETLGPNAKIVISSSWRSDPDLIEFFKKIMDNEFGEGQMADRIIGTTNSMHRGSRSSNITDWLNINVPEGRRVAWIALDDVAFNIR